jgi:hypothetical protein
LWGEEACLIANAHELKFLMDQETKWFMGLNTLISMACLCWLIYIHSKSMACIKSEITNYMADGSYCAQDVLLKKKCFKFKPLNQGFKFVLKKGFEYERH